MNFNSKRQKGFTVVELMVAVVLGIIVSGAVIQVFISNKQMYYVQDASARLQENGRFALYTLSEQIRKTGYTGCATRAASKPITNTLNSSTNYLWDFTNPIQGHNAAGSGVWSPTLHSSIANPVDDSDILTVRYMDGPLIKVESHAIGTPPGSQPLIVNSGNGLQQGDFVLVSDCDSSAIFQVTSSDTAADAGTLAHATSGVSPANSTQTLGKEYTEGELAKLATVSFYVRNNDDGIPSLYRVEQGGTPEELVEGVDSMTITYGEDTNFDEAADQYVDADVVTSWPDVVSVRIVLEVRSVEDNLILDTSASDTRLQAQFNRTISLRNRVP